MPVDILSTPGALDNLRVIANINLNNGVGGAASSFAGGVVNPGAVSLSQTITNNGTITSISGRITRVQATAACTSAAIATGVSEGQDLILRNVGATAITISTNVGVATTLAASGSAAFDWDNTTALWYHRT